MKLHIVFDITTGQTKALGKSGRWYTQSEVDRAMTADATDAEALAFAADFHRDDLDDADPRETMLAQLRDCPECRAAMARGERPVFGGDADLARPRQPRKRRWRKQKRRRC